MSVDKMSKLKLKYVTIAKRNGYGKEVLVRAVALNQMALHAKQQGLNACLLIVRQLYQPDLHPQQQVSLILSIILQPLRH